MAIFRVRFLDGRTLDVPGDDAEVQNGGSVIIWRDVLLMGRPRRIVARRFLPGDGVRSVDAIGGDD